MTVVCCAVAACGLAMATAVLAKNDARESPDVALAVAIVAPYVSRIDVIWNVPIEESDPVGVRRAPPARGKMAAVFRLDKVLPAHRARLREIS